MRLKIINLVFIGMILLSCEQNAAITPLTQDSNCGIRVKVIYHFCPYVFVQILDEQYYSLGEDHLLFSDGKMYPHIFMVTNICELGQSLTSNDLWDKEFGINVISELDEECATCRGGYGGELPESRLAVRLCTDGISWR